MAIGAVGAVVVLALTTASEVSAQSLYSTVGIRPAATKVAHGVAKPLATRPGTARPFTAHMANVPQPATYTLPGQYPAEPLAPTTVDNSRTWAAVAVAAALGFFGWRRAGNQVPAAEHMAMVSTSGEVAAPAPPKPAKKPRLPALDSIRFFLISYIVVGHFIQVCTANTLILKLFTQINVVVGAFFVLSGYVAGYTGSLIGEQKADPRLEPTHKYVISKVMGYWPLHFVVTLFFLPMFFYADSYYNGPIKAAVHGLMSITLTQAWFPMHAEVWNAPTWFLSAMSAAMIAMPSCIQSIAKMSKKGLGQAMLTLSAILLLPRLAYSYDLNVWSVMEGMLNARTHPNIALWNATRFNPLYALVEMLMGVVAARMVMLDTQADKDAANEGGLWNSITNSCLLPIIGMVGIIVARAYDVIGLNDPLTRSLLFLPLFTRFLMNAHRQTLKDTPDKMTLTKALAWGPMTYLGTISFPIFVLHGPLGQLFYKKVIAKMFVWSAYNTTVSFFFVYLASCVLGAAFLQWAFISRKYAADATKSLMGKLQGAFA
uniref:Acyltransferase 3 domain-containing protein n=1 Tax=Eutreptiella gymnastica TaxID=73025 RepID=A0A7S1N0G5_9EUGL